MDHWPAWMSRTLSLQSVLAPRPLGVALLQLSVHRWWVSWRAGVHRIDYPLTVESPPLPPVYGSVAAVCASVVSGLVCTCWCAAGVLVLTVLIPHWLLSCILPSYVYGSVTALRECVSGEFAGVPVFIAGNTYRLLTFIPCLVGGALLLLSASVVYWLALWCSLLWILCLLGPISLSLPLLLICALMVSWLLCQFSLHWFLTDSLTPFCQAFPQLCLPAGLRLTVR